MVICRIAVERSCLVRRWWRRWRRNGYSSAYDVIHQQIIVLLTAYEFSMVMSAEKGFCF
jgi:hypothetical protein